MRKNRVKIGRYAILNRYLNKYWQYSSSVFKIVSLPNENGMVKCDIVWNRDNLYNQIIVPYIHLKEFPDFDVNFNDWKVSDVLVPATTADKFIKSPRMEPITIAGFWTDYYRNETTREGYGYTSEDLKVLFSPASYKRDNSVIRYKGLYMRKYYNNKIAVKNGNVIIPKTVVKDSPCYNQIIKELKDSGLL